MKHNESKLQRELVKWFRLQYPKYAMLLFAIPNGGKRGIIEASIMKSEGVVSGVSDLMLAVPSNISKGPTMLADGTFATFTFRINGLFIEAKYGKGKQTESQKLFQAAVEKQGYKYSVVSDFDSFKALIEDYLN